MHTVSTLVRILLMTLLSSFVFLSPPSAADRATLIFIDKQLERADKVRTQDVAELNQLLTQLNSYSHQFSQAQREKFELMQAYQLILSGKANEAITLAKNLFTDATGEIIQFRAGALITNVAAVLQDWPLGLEYLEKSLAISSKQQDEAIFSQAHMIAALFYNQLNQFELAFNHAQKLQASEQEGRNKCVVSQLSVHAALNLGLMPLDSAQITTAINNCEASNEPIWSNTIRHQVAMGYIKQQQPEQAISMLYQHIPEIEQTQYPRLLVEAYSTLAQAYGQLADWPKTQTFALKSVEQSTNIETTQSVVLAYQLLAKVAEQNQNWQQAYEYRTKYAELNQVYLDDVSAKTIAVQLSKHKAIEQAQEIELLNNKNKLLHANRKLIKEEAENLKLISVLSISLAFLIAFFGYRSWATQKRLKVLAEYDPLTQIYNRRHYTELASEALQLAVDKGHDVSCVIFDLDHFKQINDNYGHATGDWVLKRVAEVVSSHIRSNDIFARFGGEEFIILLPACNVRNAHQVMEKCRLAIEAIDTSGSDNEFNVTASFGISDSIRSGYDLDKLFSDADQATYDSKRAGRNHITVCSFAPSSI